MEEIHYKNGCHGDTLNESDGLEGRDEQKVFLDGNENEEGFFGAIEIPEGDAQVYHPQLREVRNAEVSRLAKCLSISPQCQPVTEQVDDMSVRRSLRPSKSADFNTRVHLDTNDESRVCMCLLHRSDMAKLRPASRMRPLDVLIISKIIVFFKKIYTKKCLKMALFSLHKLSNDGK